MHGSSIFWFIPFWPQSQGCQSNSEVNHVVRVNECGQKIIHWSDPLLSLTFLTYEGCWHQKVWLFLCWGFSYSRGTAGLRVGGKPLCLFAMGEVQVSDLYRPISKVRRRNLTMVPGKTQMKWDYIKKPEKSKHEPSRSEKIRKWALPHSIQIFGFHTTAFQLLARRQKSMGFFCSWNFQTSDNKWVMVARETHQLGIHHLFTSHA